VKVIAITGDNDMIGILNFLDVAKLLGSHSTLQKPFEMKTLFDPIQAELQAQQGVEKVALLTRQTPALFHPLALILARRTLRPGVHVFSHAVLLHRSQES
jgi:hypothetical protein